MKKIIISSFVLAAAMLSSCTKEEFKQNEQEARISEHLVFTATTEEPTKANLDNFPTVGWEYTDIVKVYNGTASADFTVVPGSISGGSCELQGEIEVTAATSYAVYPASAAVSCTTAGVVTAKLPTFQYVSPEQKADSSAILFAGATTGTSVDFKNLCSLVKVTITSSDVTGIVLTSNNGENISGTANIQLSAGAAPVITISEGRSFIDLRQKNFGTFAPGTYYIAVLPQTLAGGLSLGVRKAGCEERTIGSTASVTLPRNGGLSFAAVDALAAGKTPQLLVRQLADITEAGAAGISVKMGNDFDMEGKTIAGVPFSGTLDGNGYYFYNCKVEGAVRANLFTNVTGTSALKNFKFGTKDGSVYDGVSQINCKVTTAGAVYAGLVGIIHSKAEFTFDAVENFAPVTISKAGADPTYTYASAICAVDSGKVNFTDVKNHALIKNTTKGSIFAGAILANTVYADSVRFLRCENNGQIKCDAATTGSTYLGGFVAKAIKAGNVLKFTDCTNNGYIYNSNGTGTVYVAGFVGNVGTGASSGQVAGRAIFQNCVNNGKVHNKVCAGMRLGGFVGSLYGQFTATNCQNNGQIQADKATTDTRIGGFMGGNTGSGTAVLTNCSNNATATITITGGANKMKVYVAGFCGNASPSYTFTNCKSYGDIIFTKGSYTVTEVYAAGLIGKTSNSSTFSGTTVNCSINASEGTTKYYGMFVGYITYTATGTTSGVAGTLNGTALTSDNWTDLLKGYAKTNSIKTDGSSTSCYFMGGAAGTPVTVGTFNLWSSNARKGDISDEKASDYRKWTSAVSSIAKTINSMNCDIIAFNEIDAGVLNNSGLAADKQLIAQVNTLNSNKYTWQMEFSNYADGTIHTNSFCNGFAYDATKLEVVEGPVRVWLQGASTTPSTTAIDGGRTLVYTKFKEKTSNKVFWFGVTHFNLGDDGGPSLFNAKCCISWAQEIANHQTPSILVGDMNCATVNTRPSTMTALKTYWADAYDKAKAAAVLSSDDSSKPATRPGTSKVGTGTDTELGYLTKEENRYDHIMIDMASVSAYTCIRDLYEVEGTTDKYWPSDHFPIKATIQL